MNCTFCEDCFWVCEAHPDRPWEGPNACSCGGAGAPCPACNPSDYDRQPKMPAGSRVLFDKDGSRH